MLGIETYHWRIGLLETGTKLLVMVSTIQLLGNYRSEPKGEKTDSKSVFGIL